MKMPPNVRSYMFGWISSLAICGIGPLWVFSKTIKIENDPIEAKIIIVCINLILAIWPMLTALGLIYRKKWAYYSWKLILYFMLPIFPIGTYIAKKTIKNIKEENINIYYCI